MKAFAFIMAFLVLALSLMPCADGAMAIHDGKAKTEISEAHQNGDTQKDDCSPFCQCSCCAGFSVSHLPASVGTLGFFTENGKSSYLPAEVNEIALPIWQPPQLA